MTAEQAAERARLRAMYYPTSARDKWLRTSIDAHRREAMACYRQLGVLVAPASSGITDLLRHAANMHRLRQLEQIGSCA